MTETDKPVGLTLPPGTDNTLTRPASPPPSLGRVVLYTLTEGVAEAINKRRADYHVAADSKFPTGFQAHVGNRCVAGQQFPADVVGINAGGTINLQVKLDGNDTYWATSVSERVDTGSGADVVNGRWFWPPRV